MDEQMGTWLGIGNYVGEQRLGPDGDLYEWDEGVDGLGNPVGFWKAARKVGRAVGRGLKAVRRVARLPVVRQALPIAAGLIPGGAAAAAGMKAAQSAGLLGEGDYVGQLAVDDDGNLFQWEEGVDGLGNPVGFWKGVRAARRAISKGAGMVRDVARHPLVSPLVERYVPAPARRAARSAGLMGTRGHNGPYG